MQTNTEAREGGGGHTRGFKGGRSGDLFQRFGIGIGIGMNLQLLQRFFDCLDVF